MSKANPVYAHYAIVDTIGDEVIASLLLFKTRKALEEFVEFVAEEDPYRHVTLTGRLRQDDFDNAHTLEDVRAKIAESYVEDDLPDNFTPLPGEQLKQKFPNPETAWPFPTGVRPPVFTGTLTGADHQIIAYYFTGFDDYGHACTFFYKTKEDAEKAFDEMGEEGELQFFRGGMYTLKWGDIL